MWIEALRILEPDVYALEGSLKKAKQIQMGNISNDAVLGKFNHISVHSVPSLVHFTF
jgi:hypothetical protein